MCAGFAMVRLARASRCVGGRTIYNRGPLPTPESPAGHPSQIDNECGNVALRDSMMFGT
jgi:hypothetical protein